MRMSHGCPTAVARWYWRVHGRARTYVEVQFLGWSSRCWRILLLLFLHQFLSIPINRSRLQHLHNAWLQIVGKNSVRFLHQIERKQRRNLIVCKSRMRWLNLIVFNFFQQNEKRQEKGSTRAHHSVGIHVKWKVFFFKGCMWIVHDFGGKQ